eukprot:CAMPEP_0170571974 /NCGR_PEP_ID=MMETSP0224-20130122/1966_1 /TAXON_ID=285029 /ORGANISM="Togula jolla, Strain CCCM 725" /LENGTH=345 /DNA_ID=CAMNT_0010894427 /DNA_START=64 /DNA_END=1101 /DNA_ORIENTATION=-
MAESAPKRQKLEGEAYYKVVDGEQYDRELLEKAELFAKDGQISYAEAKDLWELAQDAGKVSDIEMKTLHHTLSALRYTDRAAKFLTEVLSDPLCPLTGMAKSYYRVIAGERYDSELLDAAEAFAKEGQISFGEAGLLWEEGQDGKGVTEIEKNTLRYIMKEKKVTAKALKFLHEMLDDGAGDDVAKKSYYKQIDGVKYDRALLEVAEGKAGDGQISFADAKELLEDASDGKGITECERRTLLYTLTVLKYTEKAAAFMRTALGEDTLKSYYKQIDGVKYDRELLEEIEALGKDCAIDKAGAAKLWEDAKDGPDLTECEKGTFRYTLELKKFTDDAAAFLQELLAA